MLAGWNPLENRGRPNRNTSEIITTSATVPIYNVHDTVAFERHIRAELCLAQRERDVVSGAEMLGDERLNVDVRQQIAAVRNERFRAQQSLDIFDPAARSENF